MRRLRSWLALAPAKARVLVKAWPAWAAAITALLGVVATTLVPLLPGGWQAQAAGYVAAAVAAVASVSAAVARVTPVVDPDQKGLLPRRG